jgi:hypothetical protein
MTLTDVRHQMLARRWRSSGPCGPAARATMHLPFSVRATADCPYGENHLTGTGDLLRPRSCG